MTLASLVDLWSAALWRASWQGALAVVAAWLVIRLCPRLPARIQCWLWRLALAKFLIAATWTAPVELPLLAAAIPSPDESIEAAWSTDRAAPANVAPDAIDSQRSPFLPIAILGWAVLVGWQVAGLAVAHVRARRLRARCRRIRHGDLHDRLSQLCRSMRLRTAPELLKADGEGSPFLIGMISPAVVFPSDTLHRLTDDEQDVVLRHELAHFRRRDLAWGLLAAVVRAVFFFHPFARLAARRAAMAQEMAADELAIAQTRSDAVRYATLLVSVVGKMGPSRFEPSLTVAAAGSHPALRQRLIAMRTIKPISQRALATWGIAAAALSVPALIPWTLVAADDETPTVTKNPESPRARETPRTTPPRETQQSATTRREPEPQAAEALKQGKGKLVSFQNGVLTLDTSNGQRSWTGINESTRTYLATGEDAGADRGYRPAALDALRTARPGTPVFVGSWFGYEKRHGVFIGVNRSVAVGSFVSFKDGTLSLLARNPEPGTFTKKYGNNLSIRNVPADVPVEESIDGGDYEPIGRAGAILPGLREGTIVSVEFLGEGNITAIRLGLKKSK